MPHELETLWKFAPVVAVLAVILWGGHRGWWYWSAGVKAIILQLERERDEWRSLALMLLEKEGINLPPGFAVQPASILNSVKNGKGKK